MRSAPAHRRLSLRTELILLLVTLMLVATASLGSIAFTTSRDIIEGAAIGAVGTTADARKQALVTVLTEQRARATALLNSTSLGCAPEETWCLRKVLNDFVAAGGATAARLEYERRPPVLFGPGAGALTQPPAGQLAAFDFDREGQPYYVMTASAVTTDGRSTVTLRGDIRAVNQIFGDRYALGQSGETYLTTSQGRFLTPPRDSKGSSQTASLCASHEDGEVLDRDYRGVNVVHGLRRISEIGGACAMAQIDQAEAFAPTAALRSRVFGASAVLAALAIVGSLLFAQLLSRPINQLSERARLLQTGDYDTAVPAGGPAEVRTFARTFAAMARSLKESHGALVKSTEQIRDILESMHEGFFAFDREWRCTYVNERGVNLMQTRREDLVGKKLEEIVPEAIGDRMREEFHRAVAENKPSTFEQYYAPLDSWFEVSAYPTRDGLAVFGRDITERKRFHERLQQTQKLESLGLLAGGIAHDFNNLLTGIVGNASLLLEDLPENSPMRGGLQDVVNAAGRAGALTQQLLAYAGKARFTVEPLDLSELVRDISKLIKTSIPKAVELRLHLATGLPPVNADATQIQQLVMNLVINGAEAIGEGKRGVVTVTTGTQEVDEKWVQLALTGEGVAPGKYVVLDVSDTGCGMTEETAAKIFDPFFTTKFAGRGLGLAAAMGIVRGHKGALKVSSVVSEGSHFRVLIPAGAGALASKRVLDERDLRGSGTILVIDDEEIVRRTAKAALEHFGYSVILSENGKQGLELLSRDGKGVRLVVLDMTMPVMSGEETLQHIRKLRPDLPVLLTSGFDESEVAQTFADRGLAGFLQKPYSAAHLAEQVKMALKPLAEGMG